MEGVFPCLLKQLMLDGDERCLTETLQGQNHPIGQEAVHQDPASTGSITAQVPTTSFLFTECQNVSALESGVSYLGGIRWMPQSSPEDGLGGMIPLFPRSLAQLYCRAQPERQHFPVSLTINMFS